MEAITAALVPNKVMPARTIKIFALGWGMVFLTLWQILAAKPIPVPSQLPEAFVDLWTRTEIGRDVMSSVSLSLEATVISVIISCGLAYLTALPLLGAGISYLTVLRYLGLPGITFVFGMYMQGHSLKLMILTFGLSTFLLTSMVSVVKAIPRQNYQYALTLRMGPWRTLWEVTIKGTLDQALDAVRQNAAIGWVMLTAAEGLSRSEGGLGVLLLNSNKQFNLASVFAIQFLIMSIGTFQDFSLALVRDMLFPWSDLAQKDKGEK